MTEENLGTYVDLVTLTLALTDHIFASEDNIREGIKSIMGGKVLQLESERLMELGMARGLEQGMERGMERGIAQGREQGIEIFVTDKIEDGYTKDQIIAKLVTKFQLSPDDAERYYEKYAAAPIA